MKLPIRGSYWVVDGRFLAGEYPWALAEGTSDSGGITSFVDLTELHEALPPYEARLAKDLRFTRKAIPDFGCPTPAQMSATLDLIDSELQRGEVVYLHCFGGRGRTGTVVGCWLVRHGSSGDDALAKIKDLRRHTSRGAGPSPETAAQRELVRSWSELDPRRAVGRENLRPR
jgi:protein-tyrosine phosphatase